MDWTDEPAKGMIEIRSSVLDLVGAQGRWKLKLCVHRLVGKMDDVRKHGWFLSSHRLEFQDHPLDARGFVDAKAEAIKLAVIFLQEYNIEMNSFLEQLQQGQGGGCYKIEGTFDDEGCFILKKGQEFPVLQDGDTVEITHKEEWK